MNRLSEKAIFLVFSVYGVFVCFKLFGYNIQNGSSGGMEPKSAKILWKRSAKLQNMRYTTMVSDGDSNAFDSFVAFKSYGDVIIKKEECHNNVAKRLGTAPQNMEQHFSKQDTDLYPNQAPGLTDPPPRITTKRITTQRIIPPSRKPKPYEVTVVTLYLPLGNLQKAWAGNIYTNDRYRVWMQTFGWLTNKLVAFLLDDDTYQYFKKIRSHLPPDRTVLIRVNRSDVNAFKDYEKVSQIFSAESYPKHHPNTVNANYSVVMNAKYDALQMAMDLGHVNTEYIAWLDIGCFRNLPQPEIRPKNDSFTLEAPLDMDPTKVAFAEARGRDNFKNLSPWDYIKNNDVWVSGGFMIGKKQVVQKFALGYKRVVQSLLKDNMASTDQQVVGAMYSPQFIKDQEVEIKTYRCKDGQYGLYSSDIQYFCLAYICKEAAELRKANSTLT